MGLWVEREIRDHPPRPLLPYFRGDQAALWGERFIDAVKATHLVMGKTEGRTSSPDLLPIAHSITPWCISHQLLLSLSNLLALALLKLVSSLLLCLLYVFCFLTVSNFIACNCHHQNKIQVFLGWQMHTSIGISSISDIL